MTEQRMCPCDGNCGKTWDQAGRDMMNSPAALNRDQAEAMLEGMVATKVARDQGTPSAP